jgi:hypothetical protein
MEKGKQSCFKFKLRTKKILEFRSRLLVKELRIIYGLLLKSTSVVSSSKVGNVTQKVGTLKYQSYFYSKPVLQVWVFVRKILHLMMAP